jgi:hypothetical protein
VAYHLLFDWQKNIYWLNKYEPPNMLQMSIYGYIANFLAYNFGTASPILVSKSTFYRQDRGLSPAFERQKNIYWINEYEPPNTLQMSIYGSIVNFLAYNFGTASPFLVSKAPLL